MITACIRCPGRATTLLTYHHADARAFLDDTTGHERVYDGIALCAIHAEGFSAPRGWTTLDRRLDGSAALIERKDK